MKKSMFAAALLAASFAASAATGDLLSESAVRFSKTFTGTLASTVDDLYDTNAISWVGSGQKAGFLTVDLGSVQTLADIALQLSAGDTFRVKYQDTTTGSWVDLLTYTANGTGLETVSSQGVGIGTSRKALSFAEVETQYIRIFSTRNDGSASLGEVQLFTSPVPEPTTTALFLAGLGAVGFMSRRRKTQA